ncbi:19384_t:CDS:1, partial [Racocetra persica]
MLPPPPAVYNNADELFQDTQRFANSQGYVLAKKRTRKDNHGELKNMTLRCDQGSVYPNSLELSEESSHRQRSTRLIDCPFELYAARYDGSWHLEIHDATHNHDCSNNMA